MDPAQERIRLHKFTPKPGAIETHEQGIERTRQLEKAQAVFDALREVHDSI
jgi:hypothetical protein